MEKSAKIIIFDNETGGLSAEENPITEIALLACEPFTYKEIHRFETFVKPYNNLKVAQEALDKTNIKLSDINKGIDVKELVDLLIKFFAMMTPKGGKGNRYYPVLAGHNVSFDIAFLRNAFSFCGKNLYEYVASNNDEIDRIDTLRLSKLRWNDGGKYNLGSCLKRIGIDHSDAHRAMSDVIATKKLLEYLVTPIEVKKQKKTKEEEAPSEVDHLLKTFEF